MNKLQVALVVWLFTLILIKIGYFSAIGVAFLIICYWKYKKKQLKYICIISIFVIILLSYYWINYQPIAPHGCIGYVWKIKDDGYIIQKLFSPHRYLVYTDINLGIHDIIQITGEFKEITSIRNFGIFNYSDYMQTQHIYYQIENPLLHIIYRSKIAGSMSSWIMVSNNELAKAFLYGIHEDANTYETIFLGSGMHFSFLFHFVTTIVGFYLYDNLSKRIISFCKILTLVLFPSVFALWRIVIMDLLRYSKLNTIDQIVFYIIFFCLVDSYNAILYSFLLPMIFYTTKIFQKSTSKHVMNMLILLPIYSRMNSKISIISFLLYPLLRIIYGIFFMASLISLFLPVISSYVVGIYQAFVNILNYIETWNFQIILGKMSIVFCLLYYVIVLESRKSKRLMMSVLCLIVNHQLYYRNLFTTITVMDVGQGDCMIVEYACSGKTVIVDTGGSMYRDYAEEVIIPFLNTHGKNYIDLLFISHDDFDHSGALESLLENIEVGTIIRKQDATLEYQIQKDASIVMYNIGAFNDDNADSLILRFTFGNRSLFTAGDIPTLVENRIIRNQLPIQADILKLSHHGSNTSNSKEFLYYVSPKIAYNSSGLNNYYKHPNQSVVDTLNELHIPLLDTQSSGAIRIQIIGKLMVIITMNKEIYVIM